jgi:hypothetical protein
MLGKTLRITSTEHDDIFCREQVFDIREMKSRFWGTKTLFKHIEEILKLEDNDKIDIRKIEIEFIPEDE